MSLHESPIECLSTRVICSIILIIVFLCLIIVITREQPPKVVEKSAVTIVTPKAPLFRVPPQARIVLQSSLSYYNDPLGVCPFHVYSLKFYIVKAESIFQDEPDSYDISDVHIQRII